MKKIFLIFAFCAAVNACSPEENANETNTASLEIDSDLNCAAVISAASYLMARGKISDDAVSSNKDPLVVMMTYLNTYAIPKGLKEADAFKELEKQRSTLTASVPSSEIVNQAKRCMDNSPM